MPLVRRLREEVSKVLLSTLYFFAAFCIILTLKMLYLAEYHVEISAVAKATVGALVVGKVVVVLGATSIGTRFRRHMVALDIGYRSLLYTLAVSVVIVVERLVDGYLEVGSWPGGFEHALRGANLMRMLGNILGIFLSFVGYNVMVVFATYLGRDPLLRFLFTREGAAALQKIEAAAHPKAAEPG